jgi:hypothetical protein
MAKYLLLKHYRGAPAAVNDVPMDKWTPEEISAHLKYMNDFAQRLEGTGEFVDSQALAPDGLFVRFDGEGRPPVTDGPFAETKELIAGYWLWQVKSLQDAIDWASRAPTQGDRPFDLEIRPFFEPEDFAEVATPELIAQEAGWRDDQAAKAPKAG